MLIDLSGTLKTHCLLYRIRVTVRGIERSANLEARYSATELRGQK